MLNMIEMSHRFTKVPKWGTLTDSLHYARLIRFLSDTVSAIPLLSVKRPRRLFLTITQMALRY